MAFSFPFAKKKQEVTYYCGLYLTNESAVGMVFEIQDGKASVLSRESCTYSHGWENILDDIDKLLSSLEAATNVYIEKTIYFIHSYMVDNATHEIKSPYKEIIKTLSKQLELKPLGYIEVHEAVKEYVDERDQIPVNAIFVEIDSHHAGIFVYKGGKNILSEYTARTTDLVEDVTQVVSGLKTETMLPSKMIVYGSIRPQDDLQSLSRHQWDSEVFVHQPRVEIIKGDQFYQSLCDIFSVQMADSIQEAETEAEEQPEVQEESVIDEQSNAFGFVVGKDVAHEPDIKPPEEDDIQPKTKRAAFKLPVFSLKGFSMPAIPAFNLPKNVGSLPLVIGAIVIVLLLAGFVTYEKFAHKAAIVVYLPAREISKTVEMNLPIAEDSTALSLHSHTFSSEFSDEAATTGKREIGEKAKGEVSVLNFDNKEKSFAKGTKIKTGNLEFTLDQEVRVASASGVNSTGAKQAGRAKVSVTAVAIGPASNIEKGKQLTIADLPDSLYLALSESTFTGGTKKEVRTVAKKDVDDMQKALAEKAKEESKSQVQAKLQPDEEFIANLTEVEIDEVNPSKEVGEEADTVSLQVTTNITYYTIPKAALHKDLATALQTEVPSGYKLNENKIDYEVEEAEKEDATEVAVTVEAKGAAIKNIPPTDIAKEISGKGTGSIDRVLTEKFEAQGHEIKEMKPALPILNGWTPWFKDNITVSISSK